MRSRLKMYESMQVLTTFLLAIAVGDFVYGTIINFMAKTFGKHLSKKSFGLFQMGLALIGSVDLLGLSALGFGLLVCFIAVLFDFLETFPG